MLPVRLLFASVSASCLWIIACDDPQPEKTHEVPRAASEPKSQQAPAPSPPAEEPEAPKAKEPTTTPSERLGALPDDIGIAVGTRAPGFELSTSSGAKLKLQQLLEKQPVILVFYRGGWCPYCNVQLRGLARAYGELEKRGVQVVAISVDTPTSAKQTRETHQIPFPVLSDPDLEAHRAYHVVQRLEAADVERMKAGGTDLERYSGKQHHSIAVPAIFLIDDLGIVRWAHADPDPAVRPSVEQLLAALDSAGFKPVETAKNEAEAADRPTGKR